MMITRVVLVSLVALLALCQGSYAAEIMVMARDAYSWPILSVTNPEKAKGCYRKGDVVEVREDGSPYGNMEKWPDFLIFKVPGKKADWMHLMEPALDQASLEPEKPMLMRRRYKFDFDKELDKTTLNAIKAADSTATKLIEEISASQVVDKINPLVSMRQWLLQKRLY